MAEIQKVAPVPAAREVRTLRFREQVSFGHEPVTALTTDAAKANVSGSVLIVKSIRQVQGGFEIVKRDDSQWFVSHTGWVVAGY